MVLCMVLLTACGDAADIKMNADGTGSMAITLMMDQAEYDVYMAMGGSAYITALEKAGFTKSEETYKGTKYVDFTKSVDYTAPEELAKLLTDEKAFGKAYFGSAASEYGSAILAKCTVKKDSFQGVHEGTLGRNDLEDEDYEDEEEEFTRISITFPEEIKYADKEAKLENDKKTATWMLEDCLNSKLLEVSTVGKSSFPADKTKPVIKGVRNGGYYNDYVEVTLLDNVGIQKATVNGKPMGNEESFYYGEGQKNVTAWDFAGNYTKAAFCIDYTAPAVKGVSNGKYYNTTKTITFSDKYGVKSAALNGKTVKSGVKAGQSGKYRLAVKDKANNVRTVSFVIDKVLPKVTGVTNGKTYRSTKTIKFSDASGVKSAVLNGNTIRNGYKVSRPGKYSIRVTDKANNVRTVRFTIKK